MSLSILRSKEVYINDQTLQINEGLIIYISDSYEKW